MPITTCIFDAYGTLFDVAAAARRAAAEAPGSAFDREWTRIARLWREKQLQYTWVRALSGHHADFWQVTQDALDWTLQSVGLNDDEALKARLLELYWALEAYPEAQAMLAALRSRGQRCAILSNGTPEMLEAAAHSAGIASALDALISIERVRVYKPARMVYDLVYDQFGTPPGEVLFVSANGWDVAAAGAYGFRTAWINRARAPVDRLPVPPEHVLKDLSTLPDLVDLHA